LLAIHGLSLPDVLYLLDDLNLSFETGCSTLDQRHIGGNTHLVDVTSRGNVVQSVEDNLEALEPLDIELRVHDVRVVCLDLDVRIESVGGFFGDLAHMLAIVRRIEKGPFLPKPLTS